MIVRFDTHDDEFRAYIAANPDHSLIRYADGSVAVLTGSDMPQAAVPDAVTPRQIRLALTAAGLRQTVETAVKNGSQDLRDWWEYSLTIERNNALIVSMAAQLGVTEQQLDNLFRQAATL